MTDGDVNVNVNVRPEGPGVQKTFQLATMPQVIAFTLKMAKLGAQFIGFGVMAAIVRMAASTQVIGSFLKTISELLGAFLDLLMIQFIGPFLKLTQNLTGLLKTNKAGLMAGDMGTTKSVAAEIGTMLKDFLGAILPTFIDVLWLGVVKPMMPALRAAFFSVIFILINAFAPYFAIMVTLLGAILGATIGVIGSIVSAFPWAAVGGALAGAGAGMLVSGIAIDAARTHVASKTSMESYSGGEGY